MYEVRKLTDGGQSYVISAHADGGVSIAIDTTGEPLVIDIRASPEGDWLQLSRSVNGVARLIYAGFLDELKGVREIQCWKCKIRWEPAVERPTRCPKCHARLARQWREAP